MRMWLVEEAGRPPLSLERARHLWLLSRDRDLDIRPRIAPCGGIRSGDGLGAEHTGPWADPVFSDFALFDVTLTTPADLILPTSSVAIEETTVGTQIQRR
jgi:hypothetical protein